MLSKKTFVVTYVSTTDFLTWETTIEAKNIEEAHEIISKKGKIVCIKHSELLD